MIKTFVIFGAVVALAGCGCQKDDVPENVPPAASENATIYICEDETVKVDYAIDTPEAYIYFEDDRVLVLSEMPAASGQQYSDGNVIFWSRGTEATFEIDGETMTCQEDSSITDADGNLVPVGCSVWFDGCNNCQVSEGGELACTRKACAPEMMESPQCMQFAADTSVDTTPAPFVRSVKSYSCNGEEYVVSRPDETTVRITMPTGGVQVLSGSSQNASYDNASFTATTTKGGAMTLAEGAAEPVTCTLIDADYFQTCKSAGGVWDEEMGRCFEDPAMMADPEEVQN